MNKIACGVTGMFDFFRGGTNLSKVVKSFSLLIMSSSLAAPLGAEPHAGYYTHPDIYGRTIVFSCEGDLWSVSENGGVATRLTRGEGLEYHPRISPDGTKVAFSATYGGNADLYVMPIEGGEPERLTWHPYTESPTSWTPDGRNIIYQSAMQHPFYERNTFSISVEGGVPELFPLGTSSHAVVGADGRTVAFNRNFVQYRTWKRYAGGLADDIWIGDLQRKSFRQLTTYAGNDLSPQFVDGRVFFLSERDGTLNLWSCTEQGNDLKQHTFHSEYDVRYLESDGRNRLIYQYGSDLFVYNADQETESFIEITIPTDRTQTREKIVEAKDYLEDYDVSNDGKRTVIAARGEVYQVPAKEGRTIPVVKTPEAREPKAVYAGDEDQFIVFMSDRTGEYELYRANAKDGSDVEQIVSSSERPNPFQPMFELVVSPDGAKVAFADQTGRLYWTSVEDGGLNEVDKGEVWEIRHYSWSPDSRYLSYAKDEINEMRRIFIYDTENEASQAVTHRMFDSYSPAWSHDGEYLFYLSDRSFNRVRSAYEYESVYTDATKVYAILLTEDAEDPFRTPDPYKEEESDKKDDEDEKDKDDEDKEEEVDPVEIDFENIFNRHIVFPLDNGSYSGLTTTKDRVYFISQKDGKYHLVNYKYGDREAELETFAEEIKGYSLSRKGDFLVLLKDKQLIVSKTDADKIDDEAPKPNLSAPRVHVTPTAEWEQIVDEVYRYNRDFFYVANLAGNDWRAIVERYKRYLPKISNRTELNVLIGNMIGELGHGHTYIWNGGDVVKIDGPKTGLLGVDFGTDSSGDQVILERIYKGERWNPKHDAPFATEEGMNIADGAILLSVNGEAVSTDKDPNSYFWGYAGEEVLVEVDDRNGSGEVVECRVKLLENDRALRYYQWVDDNKRYVGRQTRGEVGYIHLPNMSDDGLEAFFKQYYSQIDKKAMVVDVRFNGGGNVSQLIIRRLNQELTAMWQTQHFSVPGRVPSDVFVGPMACLINQRCGSDGDIFARTFKVNQMGPLIGTRTWGGVVGIDFRTSLIDGGIVTVPAYSYVDLEKGYDIENYGVEPDTVIEITPENELAGEDPQMDEALEFLTEEMEDRKYQQLRLPTQAPDRSPEYFRELSRKWMRRP